MVKSICMFSFPFIMISKDTLNHIVTKYKSFCPLIIVKEIKVEVYFNFSWSSINLILYSPIISVISFSTSFLIMSLYFCFIEYLPLTLSGLIPGHQQKRINENLFQLYIKYINTRIRSI